MKALTLRQPWAWAVMHGGKDVENRAWPNRPALEIGETLAIHAGKGVDVVLPRVLDHPAGLPTGALLGTVRVAGVHASTDGTCAPCSTWAMPDCWHITLADPMPLGLPLLGVRGRLGLWDVENHLAAALADARKGAHR